MNPLFVKLAPSLIYVSFGFLGGRYLKVQKETLARILIYLLSPTVTLLGAWVAPLTGGNIYLPLVTFLMSSLVCLIIYKTFLWVKKPERNLLAYAGAACNSGYFGLPVAVAFLGEEAFSRAVLISMGFFFFENTLGFYVTARGHFSVKESLKRLFRLPYLYAFVLGLWLNYTHVEKPVLLSDDLLFQSRGAYTILGMMLVGVGMGFAARHLREMCSNPFLSSVLLVKFLLWPLFMMGLVFVDQGLGIFSWEAKESLLLASLLPLAANTVAFATELKIAPELAAFVVLLSTLLCFFLLPCIWPFFRAWVI